MESVTRSRFFIYFSIFITVYVVMAFGLAAEAQPFRLERYIKPFVLVHIIASMGWLLLFFYQAFLVQKNDIQKHQKNLIIATALVVISTLFSIYITYEWGSALRFVGESRDAFAFAFLFYLAIRYVRAQDYEGHKRLMLMACLNLTHPAHVRVPNIFDWPVPTSVPITLLFWIAIPIIYDKLTGGPIHRATKFGIAFTLISFVIVVAIVFSPLLPIIDSLLYGGSTT